MLITFHSVPLGILVIHSCAVINHLPTSCLPPLHTLSHSPTTHFASTKPMANEIFTRIEFQVIRTTSYA